MKYSDKVIHLLLAASAHRAVKYVSPTHIVRATRVLYRNKLPRKGSNPHIVMTFGRPNYAEKIFIKKRIKAGERFPVRKIQLQFPPKPRKKR